MSAQTICLFPNGLPPPGVRARFDGALVARFWAKVDRSGDCWVWTGARDGHGYGNFKFGVRGCKKASRVAWILTNGEIDGGLYVCHRCDNPSCVRPEHLFLGTQTDNMRDCARKGRVFRDGPTRARGSRVGTSRLTEEIVSTLLRRIASGEQQKRLAQEFGIDVATLNHIAVGRHWRHVPRPPGMPRLGRIRTLEAQLGVGR